MHTAETPLPFAGSQTAPAAVPRPYAEAPIVPQPTMPEEQSAPNGPSIKFVAWNHTRENAKETAALVEDCDVLAIEFIADNERQRQRFNTAATTFLSSTATPRQHRKAEKYLKSHENGVVTGILDQLQRTDKQVVFIDINARNSPLSFSESQEYVDSQAIDRGDTALKKAVAAGKQSSEIKSILATWASETAQSNVYREARQVSEVEALAGQYKDTNAKIGVLVGANHTPVGHQLAGKYPTERVFAVPGKENFNQRERMHYSNSDELLRHQRFFPEKPAPDKTLNKMVIGYQYMPGELYRKEDARLIDRMTDTELSETVMAIDGINAAIAAEGTRRKAAQAERGARIGALLRSKFDEVAQRITPSGNTPAAR